MIGSPAAAGAVLAPHDSEVAFRAWLRRFVTDAAELAAFDAGEIDAVMDRDSVCAHLLPEARSTLPGANGLALRALDALPDEICVVDASGLVVLANKAWRIAGAAHARAGLDVRAGENFFEACRDAPDGERTHADAVATGLRSVLAGRGQSLRFRYACPSPRGQHVFTLTVVAIADQDPVNALLTREWASEYAHAETSRRRAPGKPGRVAAATRAGEANRLLAALPAKDFARLESGLEPVTITYGEVLCEPGERMRHVYFPGDCVVSLLTLAEGHRAIEVGLVGREGMIGARLALGVTRSSVRALVQGTGTAMRMSSARFLRELRRSQTLQRVLLRFTDSLMLQISQTAVCNRFHVLDARLARWLLMTAERMRSKTFHLTHGFIAEMLGVRREGVTVAAIELQRRGIIRYRRGDITILDLQGLESACCPCHQRLRLTDSEGP